MFRPRVCVCVLCALLGLALLWLLGHQESPVAAAQPPKGGPVSFINDVAPILRENCFACHDAKKKKGKLDMTTYESFRKGGTKDDPIVAGNPKESLLVEVTTTTGSLRMPPKEVGEQLPKEKVEIITRWIKEGAKLDADVKPNADLMRELRVRWQPPTPPAAYKYPVNINALAFSPDNKKLVVGGYHELTVWDAAEGKLEKRVYTRAERAYAFAWLPDGKLAVAGGRPGQEGDVRVYDLNGPVLKEENGVKILDGVKNKAVMLKALLDSDDAVLALALSNDGKKLVSGGCDRLVRIWDLNPGLEQAKLDQTIENHADWVFGVAFSPDGKHLLTASRDKTAKIWDLAAKESVVTFPDHQQPVYSVGITDDGKTGFSVGEDNNVRFWQATDTGKNLGKQTKAAGGHGKAIFKLAVHRDAKNAIIATCSADGTVRTWNSAGAPLKTLTGLTDWVWGVAISPDGTKVAGGGYGGEVRVWKTSDGNLVRAFNASPGYVPAKVETPKK